MASNNRLTAEQAHYAIQEAIRIAAGEGNPGGGLEALEELSRSGGHGLLVSSAAYRALDRGGARTVVRVLRDFLVPRVDADRIRREPDITYAVQALNGVIDRAPPSRETVEGWMWDADDPSWLFICVRCAAYLASSVDQPEEFKARLGNELMTLTTELGRGRDYEDARALVAAFDAINGPTD